MQCVKLCQFANVDNTVWVNCASNNRAIQMQSCSQRRLYISYLCLSHLADKYWCSSIATVHDLFVSYMLMQQMAHVSVWYEVTGQNNCWTGCEQRFDADIILHSFSDAFNIIQITIIIYKANTRIQLQRCCILVLVLTQFLHRHLFLGSTVFISL